FLPALTGSLSATPRRSKRRPLRCASSYPSHMSTLGDAEALDAALTSARFFQRLLEKAFAKPRRSTTSPRRASSSASQRKPSRSRGARRRFPLGALLSAPLTESPPPRRRARRRLPSVRFS